MKTLLLSLAIMTLSLYADTTAILTHKGAKIAKVLCDNQKIAALHPTHDIEALKKRLLDQKICPRLDDRQLTAVATYLATRDRVDTPEGSLRVPKDAKCPICGMFVAKYPKWATMMQDSSGKKEYFDGVKDMMKQYFNHPKAHFDRILVQDFYRLRPIDARSAWYVTGSNIYGPMGRELIPFRTAEDARTFKKEHFGKRIIRFDQIREDDLY